MTNKPNQTNSQPGSSQSAPTQANTKKSALGGGISGFFGALMGKPRSSAKVPQIPVAQQAKSDTPSGTEGADQKGKSTSTTQSATGNEDSVLQDVTKIKDIVGKFSGQVASKVGPVVKEGVGGTSKAATQIANKVDKKYITLILKIFFALIFIIILIYVGNQLLNSLEPKEEEQEVPGATRENTPTPVYFNPVKASIYATEQYILNLEEDINVITQEVSSTVLRESNLNPPTLDFDVKFE